MPRVDPRVDAAAGQDLGTSAAEIGRGQNLSENHARGRF